MEGATAYDVSGGDDYCGDATADAALAVAVVM